MMSPDVALEVMLDLKSHLYRDEIDIYAAYINRNWVDIMDAIDVATAALEEKCHV